MSKCTAAQAVKAMEYYVGYYEKATSAYASSRDKSVFPLNKGSANYTYFGSFTGAQAQPWCAATVTTAIYDACGSKSDAKAVMYGVYPYLNCAQVWDAAPDNRKFWSYYQRWTKGKGERTTYKPIPGDIIIFSGNGTSRDHTGMVYAVDDTYVYTIEGNSGNMCRKRSYKLTDSYIYGWVRPDYAASSETVNTTVEKYGTSLSIGLHVLSKGTAGAEVKSLQALLNAFGGAKLTVDGIFGTATKEALIAYQKSKGLTQDGICGEKTWTKLLRGDEE